MSARMRGPGPGRPRRVRRGAGEVGRGSSGLRPVLLGVVVALLLLGVGRIDAPVRLPGSHSAGEAPTAAQPATDTAAVSSTVMACPGPELQGLGEARVAEQVQFVTILARSAPPEALDPDLATYLGQPATQADGELRVVPTRTTPAAAQQSRADGLEVELSGAEGAVVQARGALASGVAATQTHLSLREQGRGLEVTSCLPPAAESWLLGGGSQAGRLERLVLVNPGADPVTATIRVLGGDGPPEPEEGSTVVVPGGQRVVELVDALASERSTPVVHVTTEQGSVAAFLGDRWLQGSTDQGMELTTPSAAPATDQLVPGVVRAPRGRAQLRVAVPGSEQAVVQVRALSAEGPVRVQQEVTLVPGGRSQDVEITDLPPGRYALQVTSDVEVVVAGTAQTAAGEQGARGLAWSPATTPVQGVAGLVLPSGQGRPEAVLQLAALEPSSAEVVTVDGQGVVRVQRVQMSGPGTAEVALGETIDSVWVRPVTGEVHAAVVLQVSDPVGDLVGVAALTGLPVLRPVTSVEPLRP